MFKAVTNKRSNHIFVANYPNAIAGEVTLLSTPERTRALPEYTGRGVVMAFIDAGYYDHPDIHGRIIHYADATYERIVEGGSLRKPSGLSWHGQMTSVIAAGNGKLSNGQYRGIACEAQLLLIKVSNERYQIKEADILRGLRWLMGNLHRWNIRICNLSVGGDFVSNDPEHPIHRAIRELTLAGVTVVVASGNQGINQIVPPASSAEAISVGGLNDNNSLDRNTWSLYKSNYGQAYDGTSKPDIIAPAIWIPSPILPKTEVDREARWLGPLLLTSSKRRVKRILLRRRTEFIVARYQLSHPNQDVHKVIQDKIHAHKLINAHYQYVDGTSVATPIVSSVIAQMVEANPNLQPPQIKEILKTTAIQLPNIDKRKQGAGVINAPEAVKRALTYTSTITIKNDTG